MLNRVRTEDQREAGFTLVELLVVMLILGLLAAIAIPAFFNQRSKAQDAQAKSAAQTAETAMETYAIDNGGVYNTNTAAATVTALKGIEPTLNGATLSVSNLGTANYTVSVTASTSHVFSITRNADGTTTLFCTPANAGGCPSNQNWGSG